MVHATSPIGRVPFRDKCGRPLAMYDRALAASMREAAVSRVTIEEYTLAKVKDILLKSWHPEYVPRSMCLRLMACRRRKSLGRSRALDTKYCWSQTCLTANTTQRCLIVADRKSATCRYEPEAVLPPHLVADNMTRSERATLIQLQDIVSSDKMIRKTKVRGTGATAAYQWLPDSAHHVSTLCQHRCRDSIRGHTFCRAWH
jgi:hypothetical protein